MSNTKRFDSITTKQIQERGVQALGNRPNQIGQFGQSGLSALELKIWFDKLSVFLADKINEIHQMLYEEGYNYIPVNGQMHYKSGNSVVYIRNLYDFFGSFIDGGFAKIKLLLSEPGIFSDTSLQDFYDAYKIHVAEINEALGNKAGSEELAALTDSFSRLSEQIALLGELKISAADAEKIAENAIAAIPDASELQKGMMSPTDKAQLATLVALLQNEDGSVVDTISEVLKVFESYPQGASLAEALSAKAPIERALPLATAGDNGKIPVFKDGSWTLSHAPAIEEVPLV